LKEIKKETKNKNNHLKYDISTDLRDELEEFKHLKAKMKHLQVQAALVKAKTAK